MIKKLAALSAIALSAAAAPALAETGHVGAVYSDGSGIADASIWGGEGAAAFDLGPSFGAQVDGGLGSADFEGSSELAWRLNGHLFYNYGDFRVGAVAGWAKVNIDGNAPEASHWGIEGQYWFDRVSVGASAIWGNSDWLISPHIDYHNYDLNAAFYATDNFVLGASYGVGSVDNGVTSAADTRNYGIDAEYQLANHPISFTAAYNHWEISDTPIDSQAWTIGVRWNWGGTLHARDRDGFRTSPHTLLDRFFGF